MRIPGVIDEPVEDPPELLPGRIGRLIESDVLHLRQDDGSLFGILGRALGEGRAGTQLFDSNGEHGVVLGCDVEETRIRPLGQVLKQIGGAFAARLAADRLPGQELGEGLAASGIGNPVQHVDGLETRLAFLLQRQRDQEVGHWLKIHVEIGQEQHKITTVVVAQTADERGRNPRSLRLQVLRDSRKVARSSALAVRVRVSRQPQGQYLGEELARFDSIESQDLGEAFRHPRRALLRHIHRLLLPGGDGFDDVLIQEKQPKRGERLPAPVLFSRSISCPDRTKELTISPPPLSTERFMTIQTVT